MPEKTAEEIRADGFFITGDLGTVDAEGRLAIVGRAKDLVISGGYNVYPKEVERLIDEVPGVVESAVIGIPHADFGEGVVSVAVCIPDTYAGYLLAMLAKRLRDTGEKFAEAKFLNLPYRLARRFDAAAAAYGKALGDEVRIDLKLSQEEWGDLVGTTRESINKQLRSWASEGVLSLDRGYVVIHQIEGLERIANQVAI